MFCKEFFTSKSCRTEALLVAQHAPEGRFLYVPVFLYATVEEVQQLATEMWAARPDVRALVSEVGDGRCMYRHMWMLRCFDSWSVVTYIVCNNLCAVPPPPVLCRAVPCCAQARPDQVKLQLWHEGIELDVYGGDDGGVQCLLVCVCLNRSLTPKPCLWLNSMRSHSVFLVLYFLYS
jgi:hypothetical protein